MSIQRSFDLEQARFNMVEQQIRPWGVLDPSILAALTRIRREEFVPTAHRALAFFDMEVPLPAGQRMLAPKVEARLVQDLRIQAHETVLEIGSGSGYGTALLASQAREVLTLELRSELVALAQKNLERAHIGNVQVVGADGSHTTAATGTFDVILLSGAMSVVPQHILKRLNPGGRLAAIVGELPVMRATFITRSRDHHAPPTFETHQPWDTIAPPLTNFIQGTPFRF